MTTQCMHGCGNVCMVALTDVVVDERFDPKEEAGDRYTNDLADGSTHDHWPQMDSACRDTPVRVVHAVPRR